MKNDRDTFFKTQPNYPLVCIDPSNRYRTHPYKSTVPECVCTSVFLVPLSSNAAKTNFLRRNTFKTN